MKPSQHEIRYAETLASMPTEELAQELVRLTIQHDVSLEGINNLAEFFSRVDAERCVGEVATASADVTREPIGAYTRPGEQFWTDRAGRTPGYDDRTGQVDSAIKNEQLSFDEGF